MVTGLYDHIIGLMVACVLVVSAFVAIPNLAYVNLLYLEQQQLRNIALSASKTILLDNGYPTNWGSANIFNQDQVKRFGLALAGSSSYFVLDPDKVQRLVVGNPTGVIEYEAIKEKLNLEGYGFNLAILPPFEVTINGGSPVAIDDLTDGVEVMVADNAGRPIPEASVEATLFYILDKDKNNYYRSKVNNSTDPIGECQVKSDIPHDPDDISDFVIIFKVSVADVTTVTSTYMEGFNQHLLNASIIGENITLSIPEGPGWEKGSSGARWVVGLTVVTENQAYSFYNGTKSNEDKITWGGGHWGWSRLFNGLNSYGPLFLIFHLNVPNPRRLVFFLGPSPNWAGSRVQAYGDPTGAGASSIEKIQRNVIISGMTYIAELAFWKQSV